MVLTTWRGGSRMARGSTSYCLRFLDPASAHHTRRMLKRNLKLEWASPPPLNHPAGAPTECLVQEIWRLARVATQTLDAHQILGTPFMTTHISRDATQQPVLFGKETYTGSKSLTVETSLVLSIFYDKLQDCPLPEQLQILADNVIHDSPLRIVRRAPFSDVTRSSVQGKRTSVSSHSAAARSQVEKRLLESGARDFALVDGVEFDGG